MLATLIGAAFVVGFAWLFAIALWNTVILGKSPDDQMEGEA